MDKLINNYNGNRFISIDADEMSALELMGRMTDKTNEVIEEIERQENDYNSKLDTKTDKNGDHLGTWQGLSKPTLSDEGMRATVELHSTQISGLDADVNFINDKVEDNSINMFEKGCIDDGVFDNLTLINTYKVQNKILYFPYKTSGIYYISSSRPDFDGLKIKCDEGVVLKCDFSPNVNKMKLYSNVTFNNTVHFTNIEKNSNIVLPSILNVGSVSEDIINYEVNSISSFLGWRNKILQANGVFTLDGTATKTISLLSWSAQFTSNPQLALPPSWSDGVAYEVSALSTINTTVVGFFIKCSVGHYKLMATTGGSKWVLFKYDDADVLLSSTDIYLPNGSAYLQATNEEVVLTMYKANANKIVLLVNDYPVTTITDTFVDGGFILMNGANNQNLSFKNAIQINNFKYSPHKDLNIALIGDSILNGAWSSYKLENIIKLMGQNLKGIGNISCTNYSEDGKTSGYWATQINTMTLTTFTHVVVMLGTNDCQSDVTLATYKTNMENILAKIVASGCIPIFIIPPFYTKQSVSGVVGVTTSNYEKLAKYQHLLKNICLSNNVHFGNARRNFGSNIKWYGDNIHPTEQGQIAIAKSVLEGIIKSII